MKVEYNYLPYEFEDNEEIFKDWKELIKSTDFTLGRYVSMFEKKFAQFLGVKHCISTNNGTDALILSLKSVGVNSGDEVITVANTFYATVGAIVAVGARPVLVDCDKNYQIDPKRIEEVITEKTKAVIPVHWGGASPNMEEIFSICKKHNLSMVEDACMGIGATLKGKPAGTFGLVKAFSMHPLKSLNVMGDGGMVVTNDDQIADWMFKYRNHGMVDRDNIDFWGVNMRLQPLQAIVASHRLDALPATIDKRNVNAKSLDKGLLELDDYVVLPNRNINNVETFALYMILAKDRNKLIEYLINKGIEAKIHYPIPLNKQKAAINTCVFDNSKLPEVNHQADHLITLPIHQYINQDQINYMIKTIKNFYGD